MNKWYPLHIYFSNQHKVLRIRSYFEEQGFKTFLPMTWQTVPTAGGKPRQQLQPAFNDLLFVFADRSALDAHISGEPPLLPHVRYIYRRTDGLPDEKIIDVPTRQMENFMLAVKGHEEYVIYLQPDSLEGKTSRNIVVTGGLFKDVHGELIRIDKNRHVVVRLGNGGGYFSGIAVTYIPLEYIKFV